MVAHVVTAAHAVTDGVGDISPQMASNGDLFGQRARDDFRRADLNHSVKHQPSIDLKPILSSTGNVIVAPIRIAARIGAHLSLL